MEEVRPRLQRLHLGAGAQGELGNTNEMHKSFTQRDQSHTSRSKWPSVGESLSPAASCVFLPSQSDPPDLVGIWNKFISLGQFFFFLHHNTRYSYVCPFPGFIEFGSSHSDGVLFAFPSWFMSSAFLIQAFLNDLFKQHRREVSPDKLEEYTDTMVGTHSLSSWGVYVTAGGWGVMRFSVMKASLF